MLKIEHDIKMPEPRNSYPFGQMEVGDSIFISDAKEIKNARQAVSAYGIKRGLKFACRQVEGGMRIWRTV